jgi:hypothetical protein
MPSNGPDDKAQKPRRWRGRVKRAGAGIAAIYAVLTDLGEIVPPLLGVLFYVLGPLVMFIAPAHSGEWNFFQYLIVIVDLGFALLALISPMSLRLKLGLILISVFALLFGFAAIYETTAYLSAQHHTRCFNEPLIDQTKALYFALGTATTAGTGTLAAVSDECRRIVTFQMAYGILTFSVAIGLGIALVGKDVEKASGAGID